jgi:hypothetical protein
VRVTSDEYAEISRSAKVWQFDPGLSPGRRRVARSLSELAGQLANPDYGCSTEFFAVMAMSQFLQNPDNPLSHKSHK